MHPAGHQSVYHDIPAPRITSKFVAIYTRLFQGIPPAELNVNGDPHRLFSELLDLKVDCNFLGRELNCISKDACLGGFKTLLNSLVNFCMKQASDASYSDVKKLHSLQTLMVVIRSCLSKNPTGWEVMELLAGSVSQSDRFFNDFSATINNTVGDDNAPAEVRHCALQVALVFMCGVSQLSPGAYFLRQNFFPAIVGFVKCTETEQFAFEAILFLAILANYHKSDAAKLNPYLKRIKACGDEDFMGKICWASNFAIDAAVKAYKDSGDLDVSRASLTSSLGSMITLLPGRILSTMTTSTTAKAQPKQQPIEASVILLPIYEFIRANRRFVDLLFQDLDSSKSSPDGKAGIPPILCTILNLASYLFTHASVLASTRSMAYASLSLDILLLFVEDDGVMEIFCLQSCIGIDFCRQRLPALPPLRLERRLICAVLDCCVLWFRHNLNRRVSVHLYTKTIWICYRVVWFLQRKRIRLDYHWKEVWMSVLAILSFLSSKIDNLVTTGGVAELISEAILFMELAVSCAEAYLPSPHALYELIYELVRHSYVLEKQVSLLMSLAFPVVLANQKNVVAQDTIAEALQHILSTTNFYKDNITQKGARSVSDVMQVIVRELERDGLHCQKPSREMEPLIRSEDVLDFARFGCGDVLALMP